MTIRHFKIFIAVCEENSMTRAAARLHMTQPSISQAVREMETYYRVLLFERLGHYLYITPAGKRLLQYAYQITSLTKTAKVTMEHYTHSAPIHIGATLTIGEMFLVELLCHLREILPQQQCFSDVHNTAELEELLLRDKIDIALVEGQVHSEFLLSIPYMKDELVLVVSPDHEMASKKTISSQDLQELPVYIREKGSGTRNLFMHAMEEHHVLVSIQGSYNNTEALKKAAMAGLGVAVMSRRLVAKELADGTLAALTLQGIPLTRIFKIVYHKDKYISPVLKQLITACQEYDKWLPQED